IRRCGGAREARRRAGPPSRDRAGDARRVDLRPRPDGELGDRERDPPAGIGGAVSDGLSLERDPAPADNVPHGGEPPGAQPLTDILPRPAARPSRPPAPPPIPARAPVELTIDGVAVTVPTGST